MNLVPIVLALAATASIARADATISYRSEGGCAGDFESVRMKDHYLRADANGGSMIYDGAEKLGYFLDHGTRTFMQVEMDEDAADLQADVMSSLRKNMRNKTGIDPFEMARALCPGMAAAGSRDRLPDEPFDCGNGASGAPTQEQLAAAMQDGRARGVSDADMDLVRKLMQEQMAHLTPDQQAQIGGAPGHVADRVPAPAAGRVDRDAGTAEVGGVTCTRRQHLSGGTMLREDCHAPSTALGLGDAEKRRIARFSRTIQGWSRSLMPDEMRPDADDRVLVRRICYRAGQESGRATLAIDRAPIDAALFELPDGYAPMDTGFGPSRAQEP